MSITLVPFDSPIECMTIDTETTGLDPFDGDEILTLAMVLDIEHRESPSSVHLRVKPQHKTEWPAAERVNHISPDSVVNYISRPSSRYSTARKRLSDGMSDSTLDSSSMRASSFRKLRKLSMRWRNSGACTARSRSPIPDGDSPLRQMPWGTASRALRTMRSPMPWLQGAYIDTRLQLPRARSNQARMSSAPVYTDIAK